MILIIIFIFMILLGCVFAYIGNKSINFEDLGILGGFLAVIGSILLISSIIVIIVLHAQADYVIQKNKIQYEGLCKRYEIAKSDFEDVSKSDVINDITEWNVKVYNAKHWTESPWTNWFNPKKISDNLDYFSLEE